MRCRLLLLVVASCGRPEPVAPAPPPFVPGELAAGAHAIDLDGDHRPETIEVTAAGDARSVRIDGAPIRCGGSTAMRGWVRAIDLDPLVPGVELEFENPLGDLDFDHCFVTRAGGEIRSLHVNIAHVVGKYLVANGSCAADPMVYARDATGFVPHKELVATMEVETNCCEGTDCP